MTVTPPAQSTEAALQITDALLDGLDHAARSALSDQQRLSLITLARRIARRMDALSRVLVAEADATSASMTSLGTPTTSWLDAEPTTRRGEAASLLFSGRELVRDSALREATLAGTVSTSQARLVTKAFGELPDGLDEVQRHAVKQDLVDHAFELRPTQVHDAVRQSLQRVAPEALPSAEEEQQRLDAQRRRAWARRHLRLTHDGDGSLDLRASLPVVEAEPLRILINALTESERHHQRAAADRRDPRCEITPDQRRADALLALVCAAREGLANGAQTRDGDRSGSRGFPHAMHPRVVVTLSEESLRQRAEQAGLLGEGITTSAGELRRMCCDAEIVPVVLGTESQPLDVGRAHRLVTPGIRQALSLRDGGCVFPGCAAPDHRCEAHHIRPWWNAGATALHNMVLLCPHHHALVEPPRFWSNATTDRWEVRLDQGRVQVIPPARMDPARRPIHHHNPCQPRTTSALSANTPHTPSPEPVTALSQERGDLVEHRHVEGRHASVGQSEPRRSTGDRITATLWRDAVPKDQELAPSAPSLFGEET